MSALISSIKGEMRLFSILSYLATRLELMLRLRATRSRTRPFRPRSALACRCKSRIRRTSSSLSHAVFTRWELAAMSNTGSRTARSASSICSTEQGRNSYSVLPSSNSIPTALWRRWPDRILYLPSSNGVTTRLFSTRPASSIAVFSSSISCIE